MTIKLNDLAGTHRIIPMTGTFKAIVDFCELYSQKEGLGTLLGTLGAGLALRCNERFYSPVLPRGLRLNSAEEVREADLDVQCVQVTPAPQMGEPELIVSGHAGTREILAALWPAATVIVGNITPDDITGKVVAGTLPPHLVSVAQGYVPVTVDNFDYSKDGDLAGDELRGRLNILDPVTVTVS